MSWTTFVAEPEYKSVSPSGRSRRMSVKKEALLRQVHVLKPLRYINGRSGGGYSELSSTKSEEGEYYPSCMCSKESFSAGAAGGSAFFGSSAGAFGVSSFH